MKKLQVNGKSYEIVINWLVLRQFAKNNGIKFVNDVPARFAGIDPEKLAFETIDDFTELGLLGIQEASRIKGKEVSLSTEDVLVSITADLSQIAVITECLQDAFPSSDTPEKVGKQKRAKSPKS